MDSTLRPFVEDLTDQVLLGLASSQRHGVKRLRGHKTDVLAQLAAAVDRHESGPPLKSVNTILRWIDVGANFMPRHANRPLDVKDSLRRDTVTTDPIADGLLAHVQQSGEGGLPACEPDDFFDRHHVPEDYRQCLSDASIPCKAINRQNLYPSGVPSNTRKAARVRLGLRIKAAREGKGLGQSEAARLLGVKVQSLQQWEIGATSPRPDKLQRIASQLGVTTDALLRDEEPTQASLRTRELAVQYGDPDHDDQPHQRKAMLKAYDQLHPEVQFQIRCLIGTLAHVSNPSYQAYVADREREVKARPISKTKDTK